MKLDEATIVLRPRTAAEVMDLACRVCSSRTGIYLRVSAAALLPCYALCLALRYVYEWDWFWVWVSAAVLATIAQGPFTVLASRLLFEGSVTARAILAAFARRFLSYLGAVVVSRLVLSLSVFGFFLPLPLLWIVVLFMHEASLLEGAGPVTAVRRSARFIRGRGALAFQTLLLLLLAQIAAVVGVELLGDGLVDWVLQLGRPFGSLWNEGVTPFSLLGFFLSVPYVATARFLEYIDVRTRADGWDIQVRFMAIAAKESAAHAREAA